MSSDSLERMSKSPSVFNGENPASVTVNMVAAIHDHISCTKPVELVKQESSEEKVTLPCEFDHMYANFSNSRTSQEESSEVTHLKELLLLHLDLIQQQSEQIVTKDKQLSALRQDNETLKQRLERMERRVSLQKGKPLEGPLEAAALGTSSASQSSAQVVVSSASPTESMGKAADSSVMSAVTPSPPSQKQKEKTETKNKEEEKESKENKDLKITKFLNRKRKLESETVTTSVTKRRKRSSSNSSDMDNKPLSVLREHKTRDGGSRDRKEQKSVPKNDRVLKSDVDKDRPSTPTRMMILEHKRMQKKLMLKGNQKDLRSLKKDSILMTDHLYYTPFGDLPPSSYPRSLYTDIDVEVPIWRIKSYTSCYTMEGTENIEDETYTRRHHKHEVDERRRKRWDIQRIREQRQYEKLKQRYTPGRSIGGHGLSQSKQDEDRLDSFWPDPEGAQYLEVTDLVPVCAFGCPLPNLQKSEFSLPWLNSKSHACGDSGGSRRRDK